MKRSIKIYAVALSAMTLLTSAYGVSASSYENWNIYVVNQAGVYILHDWGTVYGLANGSDTGVTFYCDNHTGDLSVKAKCDIQHDVKLYPNQYAFVNNSQTSSTCLFKNNWYSISGSMVDFDINAYNYNNSGNFDISGRAH